jgi:hypothetical protein
MPRVSYTIGYMYEKAKEWRFRQTGFMVDVPELWGQHLYRAHQGSFSTSKIMVGYQGWTNERAAINDAFPIWRMELMDRLYSQREIRIRQAGSTTPVKTSPSTRTTGNSRRVAYGCPLLAQIAPIFFTWH